MAVMHLGDYCNLTMCWDTPAEKNRDEPPEMHKFTAVREMLCNKNLIGPYHILY